MVPADRFLALSSQVTGRAMLQAKLMNNYTLHRPSSINRRAV
jgi:hypothetical protein